MPAGHDTQRIQLVDDQQRIAARRDAREDSGRRVRQAESLAELVDRVHLREPFCGNHEDRPTLGAGARDHLGRGDALAAAGTAGQQDPPLVDKTRERFIGLAPREFAAVDIQPSQLLEVRVDLLAQPVDDLRVVREIAGCDAVLGKPRPHIGGNQLPVNAVVNELGQYGRRSGGYTRYQGPQAVFHPLPQLCFVDEADLNLAERREDGGVWRIAPRPP